MLIAIEKSFWSLRNPIKCFSQADIFLHDCTFFFPLTIILQHILWFLLYHYSLLWRRKSKAQVSATPTEGGRLEPWSIPMCCVPLGKALNPTVPTFTQRENSWLRSGRMRRLTKKIFWMVTIEGLTSRGTKQHLSVVGFSQRKQTKRRGMWATRLVLTNRRKLLIHLGGARHCDSKCFAQEHHTLNPSFSIRCVTW